MENNHGHIVTVENVQYNFQHIPLLVLLKKMDSKGAKIKNNIFKGRHKQLFGESYSEPMWRIVVVKQQIVTGEINHYNFLYIPSLVVLMRITEERKPGGHLFWRRLVTQRHSFSSRLIYTRGHFRPSTHLVEHHVRVLLFIILLVHRSRGCQFVRGNLMPSGSSSTAHKCTIKI